MISAIDARNIYEIPLILHGEGLDKVVSTSPARGASRPPDPDLSGWEQLIDRIDSATEAVRIGIVGKYIDLPDAYLSVVESLRHAGFHHGAKVDVDWIQAEEVSALLAPGLLADLDGIVIPGGFGDRGMEGKIAAAGFARENGLPCLGLCLGLQAMVIGYARDIANLPDANGREFDP